MIWEVDEDCDGSLSWIEFQAMYHRCRNDLTGIVRHVLALGPGHLQIHWVLHERCAVLRGHGHAGYEPRRLFNVVQFVMNDKESSGRVSLEDAMQIMYLRYGRGGLDAQLEEIFGTSDLNSGKTLSLTEFLHSLQQSQVKQLQSRVTAKTYKPPPLQTRSKRLSP